MISICIPTYNGAKYIFQQLASILVQLTSQDEIIISDDNSSDNTVEIINSFHDTRIVVLKNYRRRGPIYNLENALKKAGGNYIFLSDQDDVWFSDKISETTKLLKKYDCIISDAVMIDEDMNILYDSFFKLNNTKNGFFYNLIKNGYLGCCMAFNRKILDLALPFPVDLPMHDIWIGLISELCGKTRFYKKPLVYYRRHQDNFTLTGRKSIYNFRTKIGFRLKLIKNLIVRVWTKHSVFLKKHNR
jgi:glycosyltransferase involved in cell wall biosynthesis